MCILIAVTGLASGTQASYRLTKTVVFRRGSVAKVAPVGSDISGCVRSCETDLDRCDAPSFKGRMGGAPAFDAGRSLRRGCAPKLRRRPSEAYADRVGKRSAPRWDARTSNPGGAARRFLVGSTPTLFRQTAPS